MFFFCKNYLIWEYCYLWLLYITTTTFCCLQCSSLSCRWVSSMSVSSCRVLLLSHCSMVCTLCCVPGCLRRSGGQWTLDPVVAMVERWYRAKSWDWPPPLLVSGAGAARCRPDMPAMCAILHRPVPVTNTDTHANVTLTNINWNVLFRFSIHHSNKKVDPMVSFPNKVVFPKHFILLLSLMFGEMFLFTLWPICQKNGLY